MPLRSSLPVAVLLIGLVAQPLAAAPRTRLTKARAQQIATNRQTGDVKSGELEHENGRWIYSFDILRDGQTHEVGVDANTGAIVEDKVETAADESKEQQADKKKPH